MEIWKNVNANIDISNYGRVRNTKTHKILNGNKHKVDGVGVYYRVYLGDGKRVFIHRLVALHFIPNPKNKPFVNHIDNNPSNNHFANLEWVTQKENVKHCWNQNRQKQLEYIHKANKASKDKFKSKMLEMIGYKNNKLTIIGLSNKRGSNGSAYVKVKCDCGTIYEARLSSIKNGSIKQCKMCGYKR